jgi:hypothetical protein
MDAVIYEENPHYDFLQKGATAIVMLPVIIILFCLFTGNAIGVIGGFVAGLLMGFYHWWLFPRKYQIFDSKLRIVLGGPFPLDIPFDNLETARQPTRKQWFLGTTLGFGTYSREHAVQIVRKNSRLLKSVNINPRDREEFLSHLNKALSEWENKNQVGKETDRRSL